MNILLIVDKFFPEVGAAAVQYYELSLEFIASGHNVHVLTTIPRYINAKYEVEHRVEKSSYIYETIKNVHLWRVKLPEVEKRNLIKRGLEHLKMVNLFKKVMKVERLYEKIDTSLVYSPPLHLSKIGIYLKKHHNIPFVMNVQDLFPKEAVLMGIIKNPLLIKYFEIMEDRSYKNADAIVVHSENNRQYIISKTENKQKVYTIENWVNPERIKPGKKQNSFSVKHNLVNKFVVSFAGTIGFAQDVKTIIEAANILKDYKDIMFIIVGNGARREEAQNLIKKFNLTNVRLIKPVPPDEYPLVLHSSDVSLATLIKDLKTPVLPSKIISIMSAGIPVIATMSLESDAHSLIKKANCGFSYPPERPDLLAEGILKLYKNPELRKKLGKNGRKYVVEHLATRVAAGKFLKVFEKLTQKEG